MIKKKQELLDRIGKAAILLDWKVAFGGKSYGNHHLERVNKIAKFLQSKEGGDEFCTLSGAWVHDVSLAFGSDYDPVFVEKNTRNFLNGFKGMSPPEKNLIVRCAGGHEEGRVDLPIEARVVHDADVIDKSGMLGVIRHAWKMTNMLENRVLSGEADLEMLLNHLQNRKDKLFTRTAKELVGKINESRELLASDVAFALKILPTVSAMAKAGKTSDEIARWLVTNFNHPSLTGLELQLSCNYLS